VAQEAAASRSRAAALQATCGRLEAEVAYLHAALAGVFGALRMAAPARPAQPVRARHPPGPLLSGLWCAEGGIVGWERLAASCSAAASL
jgi:hypothetical protein